MKTTIIIAALIISASILLNGYLSRVSDDPFPSESEIKESAIQALNYSFHTSEGDNVIMGEKRDVRDVKIDDIRYSSDRSSMLIDFTVVCADKVQISSSARLERDAFFVYRGSWEFGDKKAHFVIRKME